MFNKMRLKSALVEYKKRFIPLYLTKFLEYLLKSFFLIGFLSSDFVGTFLGILLTCLSVGLGIVLFIEVLFSITELTLDIGSFVQAVLCGYCYS